MHRRRLPRRHQLFLLAAVAPTLLVLACAPLTALPMTSGPRWACPSATPRPTRLKASQPRPTTTPGVDPGSDDTYYQPWEQEYGLPPTTPTPYGKTGNGYLLGQRVEIWPLHVLVTAASGTANGDHQLHLITIHWQNHTAAPIAMEYATRVRLRAIRTSAGTVVSSDQWGTNAAALAAAGLVALPDAIPPGESVVVVPILAPRGTVETVDLAFAAQTGATPLGATDTVPATPTVRSQPDPAALINVQWTAGEPRPPCADPGVITDWGSGPAALGPLAAPPGAARVVQIALNQVGKPYVWGAKGPNAFDCSGLTEWSYAQIGIAIPAGTVGQWPGLPATTPAQARSGDLIFFDTEHAGQITHVGFLLGDLNGDGSWDMVHAASPEYGIRIDYSIFERPYYVNMYRGLRTVPGVR